MLERRLFAPALIVFALLACGGEDAPRAPGVEAPTAVADAGRPPIVLVSIDTLRSDRLPAYGYAGVETPAIDRLAADGAVFEHAFAQVPLTLPSHATMLTGLLPPAHGARDNVGYRLEAAELPYVPRLLRAAGYATAGAVSAYVLRGEGGFADGFELYDDEIERGARAGVGGAQRPGAETLARVRPWIAERRAGEPFFLFFHLFEPHTPYAPPPDLAARFASPYDGEVAAADRVVGALLAELDRLGLYEPAAIVLLSDHGEGLGEHGEEEHGVLLYRESLQVPLVVKLPSGRGAGARVATPVALADVAPTLLELAGLEPPEGLWGRSLLPLLDGAGESSTDGAFAARPIYAETWFPRLHFGWSELTALVDWPHHYVDGPSPELYDLERDPAERQNLIARERRTAARLRDTLAGHVRPPEAPAPTSPEDRRALMALGYVGGGRGDDADGPLPDPKTRLATVGDLKEGLRLYGAGDPEGAAQALARAVVDHPRSLDAWEYLGRSLQELGHKREAAAAYERALDVAGGRASHLAIAAALLCVEEGRPGAALELLEREISRTQESFDLRLLHARTLVLAGRGREAFERAAELAGERPENADAAYLHGAVALGAGEMALGERELRRALELAPGHTAALSDLATLLAHRGEHDEARQLYRRVLELRPGDRLATANLERLEQGDGR